MKDYLAGIVIHGICTNISLVRMILEDEEFIEGNYYTQLLEVVRKENKFLVIDFMDLAKSYIENMFFTTIF